MKPFGALLPQKHHPKVTTKVPLYREKLCLWLGEIKFHLIKRNIPQECLLWWKFLSIEKNFVCDFGVVSQPTNPWVPLNQVELDPPESQTKFSSIERNFSVEDKYTNHTRWHVCFQVQGYKSTSNDCVLWDTLQFPPLNPPLGWERCEARTNRSWEVQTRKHNEAWKLKFLSSMKFGCSSSETQVQKSNVYLEAHAHKLLEACNLKKLTSMRRWEKRFSNTIGTFI